MDGKKLNYEWAKKNMPVFARCLEKVKNNELKDIAVGMCMHVTKETAVLVLGLKEIGAKVVLCASNPQSTQEDIVTMLSDEGITVYAKTNQQEREYNKAIEQVLESNPDILVDDGADLHIKAHKQNLKIKGGTEETTTGITRLEKMALHYPIVAVNDARTKHLFDNRYGTGQSSLDGIMRATSLLLAGKRVVVAGYGWVGRGIAMRARGMGALVIVTEIDPIKALEAHMDGFEVLTMAEAALFGDIFITATGQTRVIREEHLEQMKEGTILANAGHFDVEIDVKYLNTRPQRAVREHVVEYLLKNGNRIYLVAQGRLVNLVAAEGHSPEVMDLSLANQLLAVLHVKNTNNLKKELIDVPVEVDYAIAYMALETQGLFIDYPTEEQVKYQQGW